MSDFSFRVGDKIRATDGTAGELVITAIGVAHFLARWERRDGTSSEGTFGKDVGRWELVPEPVGWTEQWINIFDLGIAEHTTRAHADAWASRSATRIGVIHLHPDGTLTMEQP